MPPDLQGPPGGVLFLAASLRSTIILMGTAPELGRYYALNTHALPTGPRTGAAPCPASVPRRSLDSTVVNADALPYIANATTDRSHVSAVLAATTAELRRRYPHMITAEVGPGFGRAWTGQNGGKYQVVNIDDYAIVVHFQATADCPPPPALYAAINNVPLFFVVDP
jgi:hypothetical protein